jgi:hypothetical protein
LCDKQETEELKPILLADLGFLECIVLSVIWLAPNDKETNKVTKLRTLEHPHKCLVCDPAH